MAALVVIETLLLVLLSVLVAGLLRSHAEILRRIGPPPGTPSPTTGNELPRAREGATAAVDIAGETLRAEPVKVSVRGSRSNTLIAFLSSGCASCKGFWDAFQPSVRPPIPGDGRLVVVTKDSQFESPSKLRTLAPPDVPVIMSSAAWEAYDVSVSPYFILVDGASGQVQGEGTASTWGQVLSLLSDALADTEPDSPGVRAADTGNGALTVVSRPTGGSSRATRVEAELEAAGIGPGHPSLYEAEDPGVNGSAGESNGVG